MPTELPKPKELKKSQVYRINYKQFLNDHLRGCCPRKVKQLTRGTSLFFVFSNDEQIQWSFSFDDMVMK